jgi:Xaa-Pro dipeptidase
MGLSTYKVPKDLFKENRSKLVREFQNASIVTTTTTANNNTTKYICYLQGGKSETRYDSDHEPIFRQESYFHYLFGVREPDWAGCIDLQTGTTTLFMPKLPAEYATVMGKIKEPSYYCQEYDVDQVMYVEEAEEYLLGLCRNDCNRNDDDGDNSRCILVLKGVNSDSNKEYQPPTLDDTLKPFVNDTILFPILAECRVIKSKYELDLLRYCSEITSLAHVYTMKHTKPGMMEYQSESLFRHYVYYNFGARHVGYTPICGCGPNAAVLHYGHAGAPNDRQLEDGDMCLMDMGADYFCYSSDITCSYPSNGKFSKEQKLVYEGVLNAQRAVLNMLKPGVSFVDCHKAAECEIVKALIKLGVVVPGSNSAMDLVEMRLGAVFMPHGLGHFIGIDTHDVGGYLPGHQQRIGLSGLKSLRTCRVVQPNMTLTVEPGLYFIDHFLIDEVLGESSSLRQYVNSDVLNAYRKFGGVRLEDVVVITKDGCDNFTTCPRTIDEVEHVMAGGKWPPLKDTDISLRRSRLTDTSPLLGATITMP